MEHRKMIWREIRAYLWIVLGSIIAAAAINLFLVPNKIAPGGVTGLSTVIYYLSGKRFPVGTTMLILNIPLIIAGMRLVGKKFIIRTLFGTILLSLVIDLTEPVSKNFIDIFLISPENNGSSPDVFLYSVFGGVLMGAGLGLVFRSGATTGGSDLAARLIKKFFPTFSIGQILLLIDTVIVIFAAVVFKSFRLAMYALVTLFISSKVIDTIIEGVSFAKALYIVSDKSEEIARRILEELERGVTALKGKGMYTGSERQVLFCVVNRRQIAELKSIVKRIDEKAFIILSDVREVLGEGFENQELS